ncbi:MAG TPA: Spi family protease inhibitor, partial [Chitinophagales bacterium]|nr:Spi family protease inhibitor [Chitinophagales bacterium]
MKKFITLAVVLLTWCFAQAAQVDPNTAKTVGKNFWRQTSRTVAADLQLVYQAKSGTLQPKTYYYVFNTVGTEGFVIVSGDDVAAPILGYSDKGWFKGHNIPEHVAAWLAFYENEIQHAIINDLPTNEAVGAKWKSLVKESDSPVFTRAVVGPLMET